MERPAPWEGALVTQFCHVENIDRHVGTLGIKSVILTFR